MTKKAILTGAGQDTSYLCEHLLEQGVKPYVMIRRNSIAENQHNRLDHLGNKIEFFYGDVTDQVSMDRNFKTIQPDYIYNLAAQSNVGISFQIPVFTTQANAIGTLNVLESFKNNCPNAKFYQASSSEMWGTSVDADGVQRLGEEDANGSPTGTRFDPVSSYGAAKYFAFNMVRMYRKSYGLFASNGVLMNHESPRRASNFVTAKIVKEACAIKLGKSKELRLGNLKSKRDWGHSRDFTLGMTKILNHDKPLDILICTGETRSVEDFCRITFEKLDLDYKQFVISDPKYYRPNELPYLKGDPSRMKEILGWEPKTTFEQMINEMIVFWTHYHLTGQMKFDII